jgi:hypothetical protein
MLRTCRACFPSLQTAQLAPAACVGCQFLFAATAARLGCFSTDALYRPRPGWYRSTVDALVLGDVFAEDYPGGFQAATACAASPPPGPVALPPELAQLAELSWMRLTLHPAKRTVAGIPPEWWQPGAFPRLEWCAVQQRRWCRRLSGRALPLPRPSPLH